MKNKWFYILICLFGLSSCSWIEGNKSNDYYLWESYQVRNTSSQEWTLHFYRQGEHKIVYADIINQQDPFFVTQENSVKSQSELLIVSNVSLKPGQTVLFYEPTLPEDRFATPEATCLFHCGYGSAFFNKFRKVLNIVGDSVSLSCVEQESISFTMSDYDIWETWYDEKHFIYHHIWTIGNHTYTLTGQEVK